MEKRDVPARDTTSSPKPWKLSKSQWAVYYWLLAHSKWNSFDKENHYYIYKDTFTYTQIMKSVGIKSPQTITAAMKKLEEERIIVTSEFSKGAYLIYTTEIYVPMSVGVLRYLLAFNKYLDPSMLITMFAILVRLFRVEKGKPTDFTKVMLGRLLGLAKQNIDDSGIILGLAVLEHTGLISLNKASYTNTLGVPCIRYTLTNVDTNGHMVEAMLNEEDEISESSIKAIWEKIATININNES